MNGAYRLWWRTALLTALSIVVGMSSWLAAQPRATQRRTEVVKSWEDGCPVWRVTNPQRDFPSPDGKYIAHVECTEDEGYLVLYVLPNRAHIRQDFVRNRRLSLIPGQVDVTSFVWVPNRKHTLVFATGDMYGVGGIRYWSGGHEVRVLRGHKPKYRYEEFALYSEWLGRAGANVKHYPYEHALLDYYIEKVGRDGTVYYELCVSPSPRINRWYRGKVKIPPN